MLGDVADIAATATGVVAVTEYEFEGCELAAAGGLTISFPFPFLLSSYPVIGVVHFIQSGIEWRLSPHRAH